MSKRLLLFTLTFAFMHICMALDTNNRFEIPSGAEKNLEVFFHKIQSLTNDSARAVKILHFGDSHIQADFFSNHLREKWNIYGGDTCFCIRDILFPYKAAATHCQTSYSISHTGNWQGLRSSLLNTEESPAEIGLSGIKLSSRDSLAQLYFHLQEIQNKKISTKKLRVFHNFGKIPILQSDSLYPIKIVHAQDSSYSDYFFSQAISSFSLSFDTLTPFTKDFVLSAVQIFPETASLLYTNFGVNGASLKSWLKCSLLETQLASVAPDCIIISLGTNDVYKKYNEDEFVANYRAFLSKIRDHFPDIVIILTTPMDFKRSANKSIPELQDVKEQIKKISVEYHCLVWDLYTLSGGYRSIENWMRENLARKDGVHLLKKGYIKQADWFFEAFNDCYQQYTKTE